MNANEGVCVRLNVIHTTSNWACKEVQNWGWQSPKPKQPGRMSDITCAEDTLHAWFSAVGWGGGEIHTAYINHSPAAREAVLWKTVNDL